MARITRFLALAAVILAVLLGAGFAGLVYYARQTAPTTATGGQAGAPSAKGETSGGDEKGVLAAIIERALSSPGMRVNVGAVDGALSSDALIRDVTISDEQGVWLRLDRARLIWSRSDLFRGQLLVNKLEIGHLEILRKPAPSGSEPTPETPAPEAASSGGGSGSLLPSLPVKVVVDEFALADLSLGEDVVGVAARLSATGHASLGRAADGLDLAFDLKRLDAPGVIDLRLSFDPNTNALKIGAAAHEPAGGVVAHAAKLDGQPPLDFELNGDGTLDAFQAKLAFDAGALASVAGGARLDRRGNERALSLDLAGTIEKLLPPLLGPVFQGQTTVGGAAAFGDDGAFGLDGFHIVARQARLDIDGRLGADQAIAGHVDLRSLGSNGHGARSGDAEIGALELKIDAAGQLQAPKIDLSLHVADARAPAGRIGRLDAKFNANPNGPVADPATRIALAADASGEGLSFAQKGLAEALGGRLDLTLRASAAPDGETEVTLARLKSASGELGAAGLFGPNRVKGKVSFDLPELKRFAELAGVALKGAAKGEVDLAGDPRARLDAKIDIDADRLATGIELADGLIGGKTRIFGGVAKLRDGYAFDGLALAARNLTALLDGEATRAKADVRFSADAPDLARVAKDLAGKAQAQGRLTGSLVHPDAAFTLNFADVRSMGRSIPRLALDIVAKDIVAAPDAKIGMDGVIGGKPASGALALARRADGGWAFKSEDFRIGSAALVGAGGLSPGHLLDGAFDLDADDLDDLTPLALRKLAGRLQAKVAFDAAGGKQALSAKVKAAGLRAAGATLEKLDIDASIADLFGALKIDGNASVERASFGAQTIPRLRAVAKSGADGSDFTLSTEARGIQVESRGRLVASTPLRVDLAAFEARGNGQRIALAGPARLAFPPQSVEIGGLVLVSGAGRLSVEGKVGEKLDLTVSAKALPLALARMVAPDLALGGTLDASARLGGSASAPTGDWRLDVSKLAAPQLRQAGLTSLDIRATGRLEGTRTTLDAQTTLPRGGALRIAGNVPLDPEGAMDLAVRGSLDAGLANVALADSGRSVRGKLALDLRAQGSFSKPQVSGTAALTGGAFADPLAGIKFDRIDALLRARGDQVTIERFNAFTRGDGTVALAGNIRIDPADGFPASIRITGRKAELVSNDIVTAIADLALDLSGPLAQRPRVNGKISFQSIDVRVPDRIPASSRPLANTVHIEPSRAAAARLALAAKKSRQRRTAPPPFNADLNVAISAPSRIFVRGRGIDAELGGDLTLAGDLARPVVKGAFALRRGAFSIAGKRLDFTQGNILFVGDAIPNLDFLAQTQTGDVTAQVAISGPADQPLFTFSSIPELAQDEVISRLLFSSASGSLTPIQALMLAQTVAELSGDGGPGVLEKMRRSLGVDSLDVQLGPDGSPRVGMSRYIMPNVSVGVRTGAKPTDSAATMSVDVTKRVRVQGEAGADGSATAGVAVQWDY
ncbi:translocation/assembly module TamB domain-containing protein [uncultured Rhodoblastus sp.]|uniref:translocation/assembly module TamB domain-containing protein n=1 Tax=uncultured Rhodoblastus sp. TaxID=543037 RepID=UPI0025EE3E10|nr:translocation/assembly module TamB domain-containing protein [uncultured Rhodoblastus sp.]